MFPPHCKEYEAIFIPNQTPAGEQNPESPESPGGPREPGSRGPREPQQGRPASRDPSCGQSPGLRLPARRAHVQREASRMDTRLPEGPLAWSSLHQRPQRHQGLGARLELSTRPRPASVLEAAVVPAEHQ